AAIAVASAATSPTVSTTADAAASRRDRTAPRSIPNSSPFLNHYLRVCDGSAFPVARHVGSGRSARGGPVSSFLIDAGGDIAAGPFEIETQAAAAEAEGYDGMIVPETRHDPFVGLTLAARATDRVT